jgi:hypothetical protein
MESNLRHRKLSVALNATLLNRLNTWLHAGDYTYPACKQRHTFHYVDHQNVYVADTYVRRGMFEPP